MDANGKHEAERLSSLVVKSLDEEPGDLARQAYRSRTQFYRVFQALIAESPGAMRRRLLLERAAWQLSRTRRSVTEIAFDAGYGSLEAFTRAYRKGFRVSPSLYRRMAPAHFYLSAPNGIHFQAPASGPQGAFQMDLYDIFAGAETWHTKRLLEHAATLTDEQLDRPQPNPSQIFPWDKPDRTLREILERMVQTKEVWTAALSSGSMPELETPAAERTPQALLRRQEKTDAEFHRILHQVRDRGAWSDTFVDALCEPPETFTFGGMFAHVITFNAYRRMAALEVLHRLGASLSSTGCPSEYEAALAAPAVK